MFPDLLQVRAPSLNFYVLRDDNGLYLLDAGFVGGRLLLRRALAAHGWEREKICGIIVTHGHLDHILNVAAVARETGVWIAAPRLDLPHYAGKASYAGWAKVTGGLERIGKPLLGFQAFTPSRLLEDGDFLEVWGGLRAIHLPGHTAGHMGFYSERKRLLFSADLFASYRVAHYPAAIFNSLPKKMHSSVQKALSLDLVGVIPNHGDRAAPEVHLERLLRLQKKY